MTNTLQERLDQEYAAYQDSLAGKTPQELMDMAHEIAATKSVYQNFHPEFLRRYGECLSKFQQPLALVRDMFMEKYSEDHVLEEMRFILWEIYDKEDDFLRDYAPADIAEVETKPPEKPKMELAGMDSNIFAILGQASRLLKQAGDMRKRVFASGSYDQALCIISEYVQTELSLPETQTHNPNKSKTKARKTHER